MSPAAVRGAAVYAVLLVVSLAVATAAAGALLQATGYSATEAIAAMWEGSLGSPASIVATLNYAGPIMVVAVGATVAARAGLINLGLEGQFLVGGLAATAVATRLPISNGLMIPTVLLAGLAGGALWASISAYLKYRRGVSEVLSTLLMNFVAAQLISWMVSREYLLQAAAVEGAAASNRLPQSDEITPQAQLAPVASSTDWALEPVIILGIVIAIAAAFVMAKTSWGFKLKMSAANPRAARRFGLSVAVIGSAALIVSGGLGGLAGAAFLSASAYRLTPGFSSNYGWDGFLVSLITGPRPLLVIPVSLAFGAIRAGGGWLAAIGISSSLVLVVQALIVLAILLPGLYVNFSKRRRFLQVRSAAR
jgi:simple sugar transport system permease protein